MRSWIKMAAQGGGVIVVITAMTGCESCKGIFGVDRCAQVPCGAVPAPAGSHVCQWENAQVHSAAQDLFVFYLSEFDQEAGELSPGGQKHVAQLAQQGLINGQTFVVAPSDDPAWDQTRANILLRRFAESGHAVSPDQVLIATPPARGLSGADAENVTRGGGTSSNNPASSRMNTNRSGINFGGYGQIGGMF